MMSEASFPPDDAAGRLARLSALMDGDADRAGAADACAEWRADAAARDAWHAYHLIGDVLRSEDLAHAVSRDETFLTALRARLAAEPVVLAPQAPVRRKTPRSVWLAPAAAAAGVMAVAGVLVVTRVAAPGAGSADRMLATAGTATATTVPVRGDGDFIVADGKLIRDARLERYLAAHKQYGGNSAVTVPGAVLRSGTTRSAER
jgi:sigma-E factor negative regulatory protein RseA